MQKVIHRHVWQDAIDEVEHLRHTPVNRQLYARRKETIERVFADAKEKHGMRWTRYRGLKKVTMQAMLTFAALNLKKLANWSWDSSRNPNGVSYFLRIHKTNLHFHLEMKVCLMYATCLETRQLHDILGSKTLKIRNKINVMFFKN